MNMTRSFLKGALLAGLPLAVLGIAVSAAMPSDGRLGGDCRDNGRTILANDRARVYGKLDGDISVFACSYRSGRPRLDLGFRGASNGVSRFQLVGETVAYKVAGEGCSSGRCIGTYVESRSLRTGRRLQRISGGVDRYVVKRNGSLAVAGPVNDIDRRLRLAKADSTGASTLAPDIDPGSLALAGSRIYWTEGGAPRSAALD